jgi:hypothetical protein
MVTRHRIVFAPDAGAWGLFPVSMLLAVAMLVAACAGTAPNSSCMAGEQHSVMETVYFGTNVPGGGKVSAEEWRAFRDDVITPRFPDGLTSFKAEGQWRNKQGEIESESTYVLQVVHPGSPQTGAAIGEIALLYQTRFHQEAVLRVRSASCISLNQASG